MTKTVSRLSRIFGVSASGLLFLALAGGAKADSPLLAKALVTPKMMSAYLWAGDVNYFFIAYQDPASQAIRIHLARNETWPVVARYEATSSAQDLVLANDLGSATLTADVPGLGLIDLRMSLEGPGLTRQWGCFGLASGIEVVSSNGGLAGGGFVGVTGTIAEEPVVDGGCAMYAKGVDAGVWYSSGIS